VVERKAEPLFALPRLRVVWVKGGQIAILRRFQQSPNSRPRGEAPLERLLDVPTLHNNGTTAPAR
jgi:hypothetical protein